MSELKIVSVHGQGDQNSEYVSLRVVGDCDLGRYAIVDTTRSSLHTLSNKNRHFFLFPQKRVKRGDYVFLHTKLGANVSKPYNGVMIHYLYWGLRVPVWNDVGDIASIFKMTDAHSVRSA